MKLLRNRGSDRVVDEIRSHSSAKLSLDNIARIRSSRIWWNRAIPWWTENVPPHTSEAPSLRLGNLWRQWRSYRAQQAHSQAARYALYPVGWIKGRF
jgi:hypothetical protein